MGVLAFAIFAMYLAQPLTSNFLAGIRELSLSETGFNFYHRCAWKLIDGGYIQPNEFPKGLLFAQVLVILFALFIWKGSSLPIFALGYFLLGGFRAGRPMVMAQARELVHELQMGITYGVMETVSATVSIITPPIAGILFEMDPFIVYPVSIGIIVVSLLLSSIYMPRKEAYA